MPGTQIVTVLKADISGSTALGEKLDPEELRSVLGSYFAALAREIHRRGGVVDKYIGDAVLAVFGVPETRDDDAERAVVCAVAMQEAIERENVALHQRYGVILACRIGIATGPVVAGAIAVDVQASDTVVGTPVALAESLESATPLGSVLVSPATRKAAAGAVRFGPREDAHPTGGGAAVAAYRVVGLRQATREVMNVAQGIGTSASLQIMSERAYQLAEQRKVVTVLFADIVSSEPLGSKLAPNELRAVFGAYFGVLARSIQHYGGTIDKYIGDAVMAVFGAPVSHEDDGVRAIRAALEIQRSARSLNETLERSYGIGVSIRIGVNTGEVVAGLLSGDVLAYTVTGDAVNTAQRIESAAPLGGVLISESTKVLTRNAFFFGDAEAITVKGKSQTVPVYRVLGTERRATARGGPKIVGRTVELARLYALYRESLSVRGTIVHVHGEAGVGKTRIISEFLSGLPEGTARVRARANSYDQSTPYALVAELVRRLFAIGAADDEGAARAAITAARELRASGEAAVSVLLELLGYEVRSPLDPAGKRRLLVSLLRDTLAWRASEAPLVIAVEDLHWRDASSADVIRELMATVRAIRCLFISTSRESADVAWQAELIVLDSLPAEAAAELIDSLAMVELDDPTRALILERTGGNPFFIEEVVRSLRPDRMVVVPDTVQDLLEARLDGLDESPRNVAQDAAVIGRTFRTRVLEAVATPADVDGSLDLLERERFVSRVALVEPTYSFVHALVQEVAYRTQLIARRRRTHVSVGDAYAQLFGERLDEFTDTLAFHYRRGDDDPKAVRWLMHAGHRAQRLYANAEALDYFGATVERATSDPAARVEAHEATGDVLRVLGRYDDALAAYERALASIDADVVMRARLRRKTGVVEQLRGHALSALATFEAALAQLPADAVAERARLLLSMADLKFRDGQAERAIDHLNAALADADLIGDDEARADALKQLGTIHAYRGELALALDFQRRSLDAYVKIGDVLGEANVHNNIGRTERRRSRHTEALAAYERALAIRQRIGDQLGRIHSHGNIAEIQFLRGELDEAQHNYQTVMELSRSIGYPLGVCNALVGLGASNVALGRPEDGILQLKEAIDELERAGQRTYIVETLRDLTDGYIAAGSSLALATAERGIQLARELGLPQLIAIALQALGNARLAFGDVAGATAALEESRSLLASGDDRHELGRTLALLARAYERLDRRDSRRAQAGPMRAEARTILKDLGAALDLRRLASSRAT